MLKVESCSGSCECFFLCSLYATVEFVKHIGLRARPSQVAPCVFDSLPCRELALCAARIVGEVAVGVAVDALADAENLAG